MTGSGSRPLYILHVDPEKNWGGGEAQVFGLLDYLSTRGHRNDLVADPNGLLYANCRKLNVRLRPLSVRNDLDLAAAAKLRRLIWREDFDIVHFHTKRAHALSLWLWPKRSRPKYVATRRMDYPEHRGWYTRLLYNRKLDGVVAISRAIAEGLAQSGVEHGKIRHIPSGIEPAHFMSAHSQELTSKGPLVIGSAAVLETRKGHEFLLEAAALLKADGVNLRYRIAGAGPLRHQLERQAAHLGLQQEVQFLGFIGDIAKFLADIDIFVMPSLHEGLGVAVLEAMAAGKPVIASRVGGLIESVADDVTGILVPPANAAALAQAIAKVARAHSLAKEMGQQGQRRIERHFTLKQMAAANETYYYELLGAASERI
ncbi:MAG TPA: glycosyltransferase family 4 protein [Candidatus Binatia bacterium]